MGSLHSHFFLGVFLFRLDAQKITNKGRVCIAYHTARSGVIAEKSMWLRR
jgi:hypothetical protein